MGLESWLDDPVRFVREQFAVEPDAWQEQALMGVVKHQRVAMRACVGPGKAQPCDVQIETPIGARLFGSMRVGDEVFAEDGMPARVCGVYPRGILPTYRIVFDDGSSTRACGEHLWRVRGRTERRHGTWATLTTEQIIERGVRERPDGRQRQFEIPRQGAVQYAHMLLPLDPYILGVWLGDGVRRSGRYATKPEPEIADEMVRRGYRVSGTAYGVATIYGIVAALREMEVLDRYSYERFIPSVYLRASVKQRTDLLCGLMDTDGGIGKDGHMEYATTSERLSRDVVWLVRSLGGISFVKATVKRPFYYNEKRERIECRRCYRVTVVLPFNPFRVRHRAERWHAPQARYLTRYIDRIESVGDANCMCIEIEHPSQCYLTEDFIVTHNTAVLAWLSWWFMVTKAERNEVTKGAAVSVTAENLRDNLWSELSTWYQQSAFLQASFVCTKERIFSRESPSTWFMSARTWSKSANQEEQGRTLSGLHGKYVLYLIDESGDISPAVLRAAEQGLSSCAWGRIVQAGNPTSIEGMLYQATVEDLARWFVVSITGDPDDPMRSPRIDLEWARRHVEKYGRDNAWVKAQVLGQFPEGGLNQLLSPEDVRAAVGRHVKPDSYEGAQLRLGVDVARFGDDRTVLFPRQGLLATAPDMYRGLRTNEIADRVMDAKCRVGSEMELIDDTGGWGAGVVDSCLLRGVELVPVNFSGKPLDSRYLNRRAEMWFRMADWVKKGGSLPVVEGLERELSTPTFAYSRGRFQLEEKEQIKARLGGSPDAADALALTFALPESAGSGYRPGREPQLVQCDYDPYDVKSW